ncbi:MULTISPECIES: hypothetical protein [unclassified Microbacterium]|nr:hypothetical protein [Microbacterium sp. MAH-37]MVQ42058.1 hypothetical protein [Microbacterium sp. MAH-37]
MSAWTYEPGVVELPDGGRIRGTGAVETRRQRRWVEATARTIRAHRN